MSRPRVTLEVVDRMLVAINECSLDPDHLCIHTIELNQPVSVRGSQHAQGAHDHEATVPLSGVNPSPVSKQPNSITTFASSVKSVLLPQRVCSWESRDPGPSPLTCFPRTVEPSSISVIAASIALVCLVAMGRQSILREVNTASSVRPSDLSRTQSPTLSQHSLGIES